MGRPRKIESASSEIAQPKACAQEIVHCLTCKFLQDGRCHRCPPFAATAGWMFPAMSDNDWCGEWIKK